VPSGVGSKVIRATHPFLLEKERKWGRHREIEKKKIDTAV